MMPSRCARRVVQIERARRPQLLVEQRVFEPRLHRWRDVVQGLGRVDGHKRCLKSARAEGSLRLAKGAGPCFPERRAVAALILGIDLALTLSNLPRSC